MLKRTLGRTGLEVTTLGLGCYQFTGDFKIDPDVADQLLNYAMESEINLFDTAEEYGFGESELLVGAARSRYPNKKAVFTSKVGYMLQNTQLDVCKVTRELNHAAFTDPIEIKRAIKCTFMRMRADYLDILMIHEYNWPVWEIDYKTGDSAIMDALEDLKREGVIGAIGLGGWEMHQAAQLVDTGRFDVVLAAGGMNLLSRPMFDELVPACRKHGTGIILGGGFGQNNPLLIQKDRKTLKLLENDPDPRMRMMVQKLSDLYDMADELEIPMTELTIRFIMAMEDIASHVPGAREKAHIESNLNAARRGPLPKEFVNRILAVQDMGDSLTPEEMAILTSRLRAARN